MNAMLDDRHRLAKRQLGWGPALEPVAPGQDTSLDIGFSAPGADGTRSLQLSSGIAALTQDLTVALTTARGSDPFDIDFGFDGVNAIAQEGDALLVRERIRIAIIQVLRREPRVRRIIDIRTTDERAAPGQPLRILGVTVQFETTYGETVTTTLGGAPTDG